MASLRFLSALLVLLLASDLCVASGSSPRVAFYSDSSSLFRPLQQQHQGSDAPELSPLALAASAAALLGLSSPTGTDSAVAKEINGLIAPNPFSHSPLVVVLALRSVPESAGDWMSGTPLGPSSKPLQLVQSRLLSGPQGLGLTALQAGLSAVRRESEESLRVYPSAEDSMGEAATEEAEGVWDTVLLGSSSLQSMEGYEASFIADAFGEAGREFLRNAVRAGRLVEAAASEGATSPALVAASLSAKGLEGGDGAALRKALEAAVAVVGASAAKSSKGSVVVAVVTDIIAADEDDLASGLQPLAPEDDSASVLRRALLTNVEEDAPETPQETIDQFVYYVVWVLLLVAFIVGMWLMCAMPVTKDTLLYSGAKID